MNVRPPRRRMLLAYVGFYLAFAGAAARAIFTLRGSADFPLMVALLALYLLLLLVEPFLIARSPLYLHLMNVLQTGIALYLLLFIGDLDYFSLLVIPPCTLSILNFPRKTAVAWILSICLVLEAALLVKFPIEESVGYAIIYPTAVFLFTGFSYLAMQAQAAQDRSEALLSDLKQANLQLQAYAAQVEELATINERNRLARELHDSVTQIIFGLTLSAQAARILIDRKPERAAAELDHLQDLAQSALAEMRALIQEMHPHSSAEGGLAPVLRRLVSERQSTGGLTIDLQVKGERRLPDSIEGELYRIAQEAMNNIAKHAHATHAEISLDLEDTHQVHLSIEDNGVGFDPAQVQSAPGHLGLTSMHERVQALGGTLQIDTQPGQGTRLRVELALGKEAAHA
ncbi:MAG TPA: sensor histidine kinase [Anaerolineaceae bacterium]|nr:sensor histidine kinase [Anaerolineaceae bacterium]